MARYLLLLFYLGTARAACFGKDASFNPTLVGTQNTPPSQGPKHEIFSPGFLHTSGLYC